MNLSQSERRCEHVLHSRLPQRAPSAYFRAAEISDQVQNQLHSLCAGVSMYCVAGSPIGRISPVAEL